MVKRILAAGALVFLVGCVFVLVFRLQFESRPQPNEARGPELLLNEANFQQARTARQPVLVDFFATWCQPCRQMAPIVEEVAAEFRGKAVVGKVDIDSNGALADKYEISAIPTFVFLKDGQVVDKLVGMQSKERLVGRLEAMLKK